MISRMFTAGPGRCGGSPSTDLLVAAASVVGTPLAPVPPQGSPGVLSGNPYTSTPPFQLEVQQVDDLAKIGAAIKAYEKATGTLPPAYIADKNGKPLLSWRVAILPYLAGQGLLYERFHLDEPWDSPHNEGTCQEDAACLCAQERPSRWQDDVSVQFEATKRSSSGKQGIRLNQITDGLSSTIMLVEVNEAKAVDWTKPEDYAYDEKAPAAGLETRGGGSPGVLFCNGDAHPMHNVDNKTLLAMFTRAGGESGALQLAHR